MCGHASDRTTAGVDTRVTHTCQPPDTCQPPGSTEAAPLHSPRGPAQQAVPFCAPHLVGVYCPTQKTQRPFARPICAPHRQPEESDPASGARLCASSSARTRPARERPSGRPTKPQALPLTGLSRSAVHSLAPLQAGLSRGAVRPMGALQSHGRWEGERRHETRPRGVVAPA